MIAFPVERTYLQNEPVAVPRRTAVESTDRSPRPEARTGDREQNALEERDQRASEQVTAARFSPEGLGTLIDVLG
jgi:hypothetical protein